MGLQQQPSLASLHFVCEGRWEIAEHKILLLYELMLIMSAFDSIHSVQWQILQNGSYLTLCLIIYYNCPMLCFSVYFFSFSISLQWVIWWCNWKWEPTVPWKVPIEKCSVNQKMMTQDWRTSKTTKGKGGNTQTKIQCNVSWCVSIYQTGMPLLRM